MATSNENKWNMRGQGRENLKYTESLLLFELHN
jgi:hypothetical protein